MTAKPLDIARNGFITVEELDKLPDGMRIGSLRNMLKVSRMNKILEREVAQEIIEKKRREIDRLDQVLMRN